MNHPLNEELMAYADRLCDETTSRQIALHCEGCAECRDHLRLFEKQNSIMRHIPSEKASVHFTARVIRRLGIKETPSFLWLLLRNTAPVFGLFVVIAIIYFIFTIIPVAGTSDAGEVSNSTGVIWDKFRQDIATISSAVTAWLQKVLPFIFSKSSYNLILILLAVVVVVALLDRFIFMPLFRRR